MVFPAILGGGVAAVTIMQQGSAQENLHICAFGGPDDLAELVNPPDVLKTVHRVRIRVKALRGL
jgi:hypothetical protein